MIKKNFKYLKPFPHPTEKQLKDIQDQLIEILDKEIPEYEFYFSFSPGEGSDWEIWINIEDVLKNKEEEIENKLYDILDELNNNFYFIVNCNIYYEH